jgi:arylformamidase
MKLIDISRPLKRDTPTWPGDTPFNYEVSWSKEESGSVNVGKITMSIHTGTHVDAPFHFDNEGRKIVDLDLMLYVGEAKVVDVSGRETITVDDFNSVSLEGIKRLLLRTNSWENEDTFPTKISSLHPDLPEFLSSKGIKLIGVDVPSVDPLDSKKLLAHHALHERDIHILEGLDLFGVEPGNYELIAMPLKIEGADGSPVRAVLRSLS